jgi:hypothetical protein
MESRLYPVPKDAFAAVESLRLTQISSRWTWWTKKFTPLFVFVGIPSLLLLPKDEDFGGIKGYLMLALLFVVALVCWWFFVADLADEVEDHGDWLLVRRGDVEEKVLLANIMQVKDSGRGDSPRIVLRLVNPGRFGRQIAFMPQQDSGWTFNPFAKTEIGAALIARVEQARAQLRNAQRAS